MLKALGLSAILHLAILVGLAASYLDVEEPFLIWPAASCDTPPKYQLAWHLGDLLQNARPDRVRVLLGETASSEAIGQNECWQYRFRGGETLTLEFEAGVVRRSWFGSEPIPGGCRSGLARSVSMNRHSRPPAWSSVDCFCMF